MVKVGEQSWMQIDKIVKFLLLCYELASFKLVNNRAHTYPWGVEGVLQRQGVDTTLHCGNI